MENFTDPPFGQLCTIVSSTPSKPGGFFIPFENTSLTPINLQTGYKVGLGDSIDSENIAIVSLLSRYDTLR